MAALIAFTVGLLAFLAVDAAIEGLEIAGAAPGAFGGADLVFLGALTAYLALGGRRRLPARRRSPGRSRRRARAPTWRCWSRSASASTTSARGWRSAPPTRSARWRSAPSWCRLRDPQHDRGPGDRRPARRRRRRGGAAAPRAPARPRPARRRARRSLGAWIGAAAFNPSLAALLFGVGVGAIAQVIVQLAPADARRARAGSSTRPRSPACSPASPLLYADRAAGERLMATGRLARPSRGDRGLREGDLRALRRTRGAGHQRRARRAARGHAGDGDLDAEAPLRPRPRRLQALQGRDADPGRREVALEVIRHHRLIEAYLSRGAGDAEATGSTRRPRCSSTTSPRSSRR